MTETPSGSCEKARGGGEWTALRELATAISEARKHTYLPVDIICAHNKVKAEALAAAAPATRDSDDWCAGCGKMKCVCKTGAPPPQDGQPADEAEIDQQIGHLAEWICEVDGYNEQTLKKRIRACFNRLSMPDAAPDKVDGIEVVGGPIYARPPQDGQGAELLRPPRGGSSSDLAGSRERSAGYNECLYCGEPVQAPALYCCEEHEEGRRME